jgi:mRNA interferase RelE/StbE
MSYSIVLKDSAERELSRLPSSLHARVIKKLRSLESNPRPSGMKKLQGHQGYRIRVGDYRILFEVDDRERRVYVYSVAHRKEVYR